LVAIAVLALGAGLMALSSSPSWVWPIALMIVSVLWLFVDGPVEGPILLRFNDQHGLTASDLLTPLWLGYGGYRLAGRRASTRSHFRSRH
jgi:hypothetical protein